MLVPVCTGGVARMALALAWDHTEVSFQGTSDPIVQEDVSAIASYWSQSDWVWKCGAHRIISNDTSTDEGTMVMLASHRGSWRSALGVDLIVAHHPHLGDDGLTTWQATPTWTFGRMLGARWWGQVSLAAHFLYLEQNTVISDDLHLLWDQTLRCGMGPWTISTQVQWGDQRFGSVAGGTVVRNSTDNVEQVLVATLSYQPTEPLRLWLSYTYQQVAELDGNASRSDLLLMGLHYRSR